MTSTDSTTGRQPLPELVGFKPFYGVPICSVGDDGEIIIALGHHPQSRALAVFNAYARSIGEKSLDHMLDDFVASEAIYPAWGVLLGECGDCTAPNAPTCAQCTEIRAGGWWMQWDATEDMPEAFPITVLES